MKYVISRILISGLLVGAAYAADTEIKLDDIETLRSPAAPAFTLLGVGPTAIERPGSPRDFAVSILSANERSEGEFPKDLAIEFAPYWWFSHPELVYQDVATPANPFRSALQSLSISIATTGMKSSETNQTEAVGTSLALGFRCLLLQGRFPDGHKEAYQKLQDSMKAYLATVPFAETLPERPTEPVSSTGEEPTHVAAWAGLKKAREDMAAFKQREGWVLELAGGAQSDYPEDDTGSAEWTRYGLWLTPSYRASEGLWSRVSVVGVGRYLWDDTKGDGRDVFDAGGRVIWQNPHTPLSLSAEYVYRESEGDHTDRLVAMLEYQIGEDLYLIASYGKEFAEDFEGDGDLIALAGVNFGWGKGPSIK